MEELLTRLEDHYKGSEFASTDRQVSRIRQLIRELDGRVIRLVDLSLVPVPTEPGDEAYSDWNWLFYTQTYSKDEMQAETWAMSQKDIPNSYEGRSGIKRISSPSAYDQLPMQIVRYSFPEVHPVCGRSSAQGAPCFELDIRLKIAIDHSHDIMDVVRDASSRWTADIKLISVEDGPCGRNKRCIDIGALLQ